MVINIAKSLSSVKKGDSVLLLVNSKNYANDNIAVVKQFSSKHYKGIYVTVNRPYDTVISTLKQKKIKTDSLYFIDMISRRSRKDADLKNENCVFMDSPESLTGTGIALEQMARSIPGEKYIFFDSLSTLLTYNQKQVVLKFAHFLATKTRDWGVVGIVISVKQQTDENMLSQLEQFFDKVIIEN